MAQRPTQRKAGVGTCQAGIEMREAGGTGQGGNQPGKVRARSGLTAARRGQDDPEGEPILAEPPA